LLGLKFSPGFFRLFCSFLPLRGICICPRKQVPILDTIRATVFSLMGSGISIETTPPAGADTSQPPEMFTWDMGVKKWQWDDSPFGSCANRTIPDRMMLGSAEEREDIEKYFKYFSYWASKPRSEYLAYLDSKPRPYTGG